MNKKGFTLIELVLVIAILGILAVTALPNIFNISLTTARSNARDAVVGSIQAGLSLYAAQQISTGAAESYPALLEATDLANATAAARGTSLFNEVIQGGVSNGWTKKDDDCYTWTEGGATDDYQYSNVNGTFLYVAAGC